jgi:hypothetical protein
MFHLTTPNCILFLQLSNIIIIIIIIIIGEVWRAIGFQLNTIIRLIERLMLLARGTIHYIISMLILIINMITLAG